MTFIVQCRACGQYHNPMDRCPRPSQKPAQPQTAPQQPLTKDEQIAALRARITELEATLAVHKANNRERVHRHRQTKKPPAIPKT